MAHPLKFLGRALALMSLCALACSSQTVTLSRYVPSDVALPELNSLAVAPLGGEDGHDVGMLLTASLGRSGTWSITQPQELGGAPLPGLNEVLAHGRALGVDAIFDGAFEASAPQTVYGARLGPTAGGGQICTLERQLRVEVQGHVLLLSTLTGRTLLFEPVQHVFVHSEVWSGPSALVGGACTEQVGSEVQHLFGGVHAPSLRLQALQDYVQTLTDRLVPHWEGEQVMLYSERSIPESERAIEALLRGDWDEGVAIYRRGVKAAQSYRVPTQVRAKAHYNLGTTLAFGGCIEEGLMQLHIAQALAPSEVYTDQIARIESYAQTRRQGGSGHRLWQCHRDSACRPICQQTTGP